MQALLFLILALGFSPNGRPREGEGQPSPPKRIHYVEPEFPAAARQVSPPLQGIVILKMTLNEQGQPVDIKVLRPMPLLDQAAVDAARQWRYEATTVNGVPARVIVQEVVDVFPDHETRARYWADMLGKTKLERPFRLLAAERLGLMGLRKRYVFEALRKASTDRDPDIRAAAARALEALGDPNGT